MHEIVTCSFVNMSFELIHLLFNHPRKRHIYDNANDTLLSQKDEIFNAYQFILFPKIFAKAKCRTAYIVNSYLCKIRKLYSFQYAQKITRTHQTFLTV